jgi:hypothetical protein
VTRDYRTLDAVVVCASLLIMAGVMATLAMPDISQPTLPTLASGPFGAALGTHVGARWGNKKPTTDAEVRATPEPGGPATVSLEPKP